MSAGQKRTVKKKAHNTDLAAVETKRIFTFLIGFSNSSVIISHPDSFLGSSVTAVPSLSFSGSRGTEAMPDSSFIPKPETNVIFPPQ